MTIKLNGELGQTEARTVAALLREQNAPTIGVAVALNGAVVRRAEHEATPLKENDEVEIIRAVQGG
jgi:thiamine biosynthesis protein ThiS